MNRFNFLTHKCIFSNLNTINSRLSATIVDYAGLGKKFKKDSGEINPLESIEI